MSDSVSVPLAPESARKDVLVVPETVESSGKVLTGRRLRSAFWRARALELQLAAQHAAELRSVSTGVGGIGASVGGLKFPESMTVQTKWSPDDLEVQRSAANALGQIAKFSAAQSEGCGTLSTISNRAFVIIAKLTTLASFLMDRGGDVTPDSVGKLLGRYVDLIGDIEKRLQETELEEAVLMLHAATELKSLEGLKPDDAFFAELNHRAALLLGLKCLVATRLRDGEAPGEWPPGQPTEPQPEPPSVAAKKTGRK